MRIWLLGKNFGYPAYWRNRGSMMQTTVQAQAAHAVAGLSLVGLVRFPIFPFQIVAKSHAHRMDIKH